ncbi:unnamed protein product [Acanthoscelides obtectus]|uniref:Uncharacterized protein n=1 Tax=Acanthoscelides obtectus TaxID=200917 RepID=A0A9P0KGB7_ACAOB|nr:unnamed protein product [Acanthoscelides obtectus]CAK1640947.1 hypothetical protein AOBTE_LOCUS12035 [Acanthoscelides obtectus]
MMPDMFDILLSLVMSKIQRQHTIMREALPAKVKLEITLDFLSSGISYRRLSHFYRVSRFSLSKFIPEVCEEIFKALKENIKIPNNAEEWAKIENGFRKKWNFLLCCGAIDGKHMHIIAPGNIGTVMSTGKILMQEPSPMALGEKKLQDLRGYVNKGVIILRCQQWREETPLKPTLTMMVRCLGN